MISDTVWDHPHTCGDKLSKIKESAVVTESHTDYSEASTPLVADSAISLSQLFANVNPTDKRFLKYVLDNFLSAEQIDAKHEAQKIEGHPHACGDKNSASQYASGVEVSSPRVWGQDSESNEPEIKLRVIPTRVGTRCIMSAINYQVQSRHLNSIYSDCYNHT